MQKLKISLIDALNALLEPVRSHFTNDPVAKDLLAKVQQYKKEKVRMVENRSTLPSLAVCIVENRSNICTSIQPFSLLAAHRSLIAGPPQQTVQEDGRFQGQRAC